MAGYGTNHALIVAPEVEASEKHHYANQTILEIFNQRWMMLVCQHLSRGPVRFNELAKKTGVNPNTLRERLRELEEKGLVTRNVLSVMPPKVEYSFTPKSAGLVPIIKSLESWLTTEESQVKSTRI